MDLGYEKGATRKEGSAYCEPWLGIGSTMKKFEFDSVFPGFIALSLRMVTPCIQIVSGGMQPDI